MKKTKGITKTYKKEIDLSEIDILLNETIHKDWYDDDPNESIYTHLEKKINITKRGKGSWEGEAIPVKIDDAIKVLEKLKKAGSNYCEVMYHSDHCGYVFNGMEIRKSTEAEITEFKNKAIKKAKLEKEMEKMRLEYEKKHKKLLNESTS